MCTQSAPRSWVHFLVRDTPCVALDPHLDLRHRAAQGGPMDLNGVCRAPDGWNLPRLLHGGGWVPFGQRVAPSCHVAFPPHFSRLHARPPSPRFIVSGSRFWCSQQLRRDLLHRHVANSEVSESRRQNGGRPRVTPPIPL